MTLALNPPGSARDCFEDTEAHGLATYELRFTIRRNPDDPPIEPQGLATDPPDEGTAVDPNAS